MSTVARVGEWTLTMNRDAIDVTSSSPTVDSHWRGTDTQSHEHYYDHGYPTLRLVVDSQHWCDGSEGTARHDPHMQVDESHYECLTCGEEVTPGLLPAYHPQSIPGLVDAEMSGPLDGATVRLWLTEDQCRMVSAAADPDDVAEQIARLNPEQITSWTS